MTTETTEVRLWGVECTGRKNGVMVWRTYDIGTTERNEPELANRGRNSGGFGRGDIRTFIRDDVRVGAPTGSGGIRGSGHSGTKHHARVHFAFLSLSFRV